MNISVAFNTFTVLGNHNLYLVHKHFHYSSILLCICEVVPPVLPLLHQPWQIPICFYSQWTCLPGIFHISGIIQYVIFCIYLHSLGSMFVKVTHIVAHSRTSSLLTAEYPIKRVYPNPFILPSAHLGCFYVLSLVNIAAMNSGVQTFSDNCFQFWGLYT